MLKNTSQEIKYRLAKWVIKNLEAEQLLQPDEIEEIWQGLLSFYDPPMVSIESPCESIIDTFQGVKRNA